jgi:hypothetical protein
MGISKWLIVGVKVPFFLNDTMTPTAHGASRRASARGGAGCVHRCPVHAARPGGPAAGRRGAAAGDAAACASSSDGPRGCSWRRRQPGVATGIAPGHAPHGQSRREGVKKRKVGIMGPRRSNWTKSLRDSLELTALVMLRGMHWCDTWDRRAPSSKVNVAGRTVNGDQ